METAANRMETKMRLQDYRPGAVGSLLDEYQRATFQLKEVLDNVSEDHYEEVADAETKK